MATLSKDRAALRASILKRIRDDLHRVRQEIAMKSSRSTGRGRWEDDDSGLCWSDALVRRVGDQLLDEVLEALADIEYGADR